MKNEKRKPIKTSTTPIRDMADIEQRALQVATIILIAVITFLFIKQQIILAMILGAIILGLQKAYLRYKKKQGKT